MPHNPTFLAVVGKGGSSPLNHKVLFESLGPVKNWQGYYLTPFCIVSRGNCFTVVSPKPKVQITSL